MSAQIIDRRPWGYFEILSDKKDHKVKRIIVNPGKRLSLQRHKSRQECWVIVSGNARVICEKEVLPAVPGDPIVIPRGATHRIENVSDVDLVFIEVQTGEYFGEDDIERLEDDYDRITENKNRQE